MRSRRIVMMILLAVMIAPSVSFGHAILAGKRVGDVHIGMRINEALRALKGPVAQKVLEPQKKELFSGILGVAGIGDLVYDRIIHVKEKGLILVILDKRVVGIVDLNDGGMLEDVISLKRGAETILVFYGKAGMVVARRGNHRIYSYPKRGIAFFDDNSDGTFNMVIVWKK